MTADVSVSGMGVSCPNCGQMAIAQDGQYDFSSQIEDLIRKSNVTKKQARRFIRKVESAANLDALPVAASAINEDLEKASKLALRQSEPASAFKTICRILREVILVGSAAAVGLAAAGEVYDMYVDKETPQIEAQEFEEKPNKEEEDDVDQPSIKWLKPPDKE